MPKIIQFLHTQVEATPLKNSNDMFISWNNNKKHRRKFICQNGKALINDIIVEKELVFWGEWEAQSSIKKLQNNTRRYPKFLNYPFIDLSVASKTHNTDPYIFGTNFRYIVCLQRYFVNILRKLDAGDIILFGSCIDKNFCLDTVFVISDKIIPYNQETIHKFKENSDTRGQFYEVSVVPMITKSKHSSKQDEEDNCKIDDQIYKLYFGVNYEQRENYNNIFSFVPVKVLDANNEFNYIFQQPIIDFSWIAKTKTQGINVYECGQDEIESFWNEVVKQVKAQGLELGISFKTPQLRNQ
jgi:hypothetical protein